MLLNTANPITGISALSRVTAHRSYEDCGSLITPDRKDILVREFKLLTTLISPQLRTRLCRKISYAGVFRYQCDGTDGRLGGMLGGPAIAAGRTDRLDNNYSAMRDTELENQASTLLHEHIGPSGQ